MKLFYTVIVMLVVFATGPLVSASEQDPPADVDQALKQFDADWYQNVQDGKHVTITMDEAHSMGSVTLLRVFSYLSEQNAKIAIKDGDKVTGLSLDRAKADLVPSELIEKEEPVSETESSEKPKGSSVNMDANLQEFSKVSLRYEPIGSYEPIDQQEKTADSAAKMFDQPSAIDGLTADSSLKDMFTPSTVGDDSPPKSEPKEEFDGSYKATTNNSGNVQRVVLSQDAVTVYERGRKTNIVSSGSPYSVTIVGDRPDQEGTVNGESAVGQVLPHDRGDLARTGPASKQN